MENEFWKDIQGYEGLYKVSNLGQVIRLPSIINRLGYDVKVRGSILKPLDNGKGYLRVKLSINGKDKRIMLHRILADAFIKNPKNKPFINHINGNKKDNRIENLEWCTQRENCIHSIKNGFKKITPEQRLKMSERMKNHKRINGRWSK